MGVLINVDVPDIDGAAATRYDWARSAQAMHALLERAAAR